MTTLNQRGNPKNASTTRIKSQVFKTQVRERLITNFLTKYKFPPEDRFKVASLVEQYQQSQELN